MWGVKFHMAALVQVQDFQVVHNEKKHKWPVLKM